MWVWAFQGVRDSCTFTHLEFYRHSTTLAFGVSVFQIQLGPAEWLWHRPGCSRKNVARQRIIEGIIQKKQEIMTLSLCDQGYRLLCFNSHGPRKKAGTQVHPNGPSFCYWQGNEEISPWFSLLHWCISVRGPWATLLLKALILPTSTHGQSGHW